MEGMHLSHPATFSPLPLGNKMPKGQFIFRWFSFYGLNYFELWEGRAHALIFTHTPLLACKKLEPQQISAQADYCNVLYMGLLLSRIWTLQLVQNAEVMSLIATEHPNHIMLVSLLTTSSFWHSVQVDGLGFKTIWSETRASEGRNAAFSCLLSIKIFTMLPSLEIQKRETEGFSRHDIKIVGHSPQ